MIEQDTVVLDGHKVAVQRLDEFYNGSDGSRVTDSQWDTSRDRTAGSVEDLQALGFEYVGAVCPEGHSLAKEVFIDGNLVTTNN